MKFEGIIIYCILYYYRIRDVKVFCIPQIQKISILSCNINFIILYQYNILSLFFYFYALSLFQYFKCFSCYFSFFNALKDTRY